MKTKFLRSVAPLLVVASGVLAPAAAQAAETPHFYRNLVPLEEGRRLPYIGWGRLQLHSPEAVIECAVAVGGSIENPAGGAGKEEVETFDPYDCSLQPCETEGAHSAVMAEDESEPGLGVRLHWPGELIEPGGVLRLKSTNLRLTVLCRKAHSLPTEVGLGGGLVERSLAETDVEGNAICQMGATGKSEPKWKNGTSVGKPSKLDFETSGELECTPGVCPSEECTAFKAPLDGVLKIMGFEESELITAK